MRTVQALVEMFDPEREFPASYTEELGPFESNADSDFDAEDDVWEELEEQGHKVLATWTVEA